MKGKLKAFFERAKASFDKPVMIPDEDEVKSALAETMTVNEARKIVSPGGPRFFPSVDGKSWVGIDLAAPGTESKNVFEVPMISRAQMKREDSPLLSMGIGLIKGETFAEVASSLLHQGPGYPHSIPGPVPGETMQNDPSNPGLTMKIVLEAFLKVKNMPFITGTSNWSDAMAKELNKSVAVHGMTATGRMLLEEQIAEQMRSAFAFGLRERSMNERHPLWLEAKCHSHSLTGREQLARNLGYGALESIRPTEVRWEWIERCREGGGDVLVRDRPDAPDSMSVQTGSIYGVKKLYVFAHNE